MIGTTTTVNVGSTDAAVGTSGAPCRVFQKTVLSDGTAGVCLLRNGTSASGAIWVNTTNTINKSVTVNFGEEGILFPGGCFADVDAHCIATLITYRNEMK